MILVDTSVWVDHLRAGDRRLAELLQANSVAIHPFVVGEIACGSLSNRRQLLELLNQLPMAPVAEHDEVLGFLERNRLHTRGIGYVDVHLLASVMLGGMTLWTRDKRLQTVAESLGCAHADPR